jgi:hypothetical protein
VSATTYFTGEAVPTNDGNGSNVTVPFTLTVYVPSFGTVNVVKLQLAFAVDVVAHNFTVLATKVAGFVAESLLNGEIVWLVSYAPVDVSFTPTGGAGITGVRVDVEVCPKMSVTLYVSAVFVPCVALTSATKVTTPVDVFNV